MGSKQSVFTKEELKDYEELTFLNKQEILNCYNRFEFLVRTGSPDEATLQARLAAEAAKVTRTVGKKVVAEAEVRGKKYGKKIARAVKRKKKSDTDPDESPDIKVEAKDQTDNEDDVEAAQVEEVGRRASSLQGLESIPIEEREEDDDGDDSSLDLEMEQVEDEDEAEEQPKSTKSDGKEEQLPREVVLSSLVEISLMRRVPELRFNPFADRICAAFSSRSDGKMSFEDFLDMASVLSEHAPTQLKADWAFKMFDFDGDGYLGESDVRRVVLRLTGFDPESSSGFFSGEAASTAVKQTWRFLSSQVTSLVSSGADAENGPNGDESAVVAIEEAGAEDDDKDEEEKTKLTEEEIGKIVDNILHEADLNKSSTICISEFRYIMGKSPDFAHNFRIRF